MKATGGEMRKVVAVEYVTVDGVIADPGGLGEIEHGGWSSPYFNDKLAKYQSDQLVASDAPLLERETFEAGPVRLARAAAPRRKAKQRLADKRNRTRRAAMT